MASSIDQDKILTFLATEDGKKKILEGIKVLKTLYPEMEDLEELLIAPSLKYKPNTIFILAKLKGEESYILSELIQELIEHRAKYEGENGLLVLNSADMVDFHKNGMIDEQEHINLEKYSIRLEDFNIELYEVRKAEYERSCKLPKIKPKGEMEVEVEVKVEDEFKHLETRDEIDTQDTEDKFLQQLETKQKDEMELEEEEEVKCESQEKKDEDEDELVILKNHADDDYKELSIDQCKEIVKKLQSLLETRKRSRNQDKSTLLHLAVDRGGPECSYQFISIGQAMAVTKFLLGLDPKMKAGHVPPMLLANIEKIKNINAQDELGRTALHLAAKSSGGILYWMLKLKADPFIKDSLGNTFFEYIPGSWFLIKNSLAKYLKKIESKETP